MKWSALAAVILVACSGGKDDDTTADTPADTDTDTDTDTDSDTDTDTDTAGGSGTLTTADTAKGDTGPSSGSGYTVEPLYGVTTTTY